MKALITGASSGIGRDMARLLSQQGYDLILVARRTERLEMLKQSLDTNVTVFPADLADEQTVLKLYKTFENEDIDVVINNAGFGLFGAYDKVPHEKEMNMLDVNVRAVHLLTKYFLQKLEKQGHGYLLNVASSAGFLPGPLMSTYYATKAYVVRYTEALREELKRRHSKVSVSLLCPGPVRTEFDEVAGVRFSLAGMKSEAVADYALKKMFAGKLIITPGFIMKAVRVLQRLVPDSVLAHIAFNRQKRKEDNK